MKQEIQVREKLKEVNEKIEFITDFLKEYSGTFLNNFDSELSYFTRERDILLWVLDNRPF